MKKDNIEYADSYAQLESMSYSEVQIIIATQIEMNQANMGQSNMDQANMGYSNMDQADMYKAGSL